MYVKFIPLDRRGFRCEDKIKSDLKKTGREDVEWIHLDRDRDLRPAAVNKNKEYVPATFVIKRLLLKRVLTPLDNNQYVISC
jgi:hypothetical protein